jgi:hypothetical protein
MPIFDPELIDELWPEVCFVFYPDHAFRLTRRGLNITGQKSTKQTKQTGAGTVRTPRFSNETLRDSN